MKNTLLKQTWILLLLLACTQLQAQENRGAVMAKTTETESKGKFHAIIISENDYEDSGISDLLEPEKDGDQLQRILQLKYGFLPDAVIRLKNAKRADIYKAIEKKTKTLSPDDNLLLFYAGHGYWDENLKMGYWLPADAQKESKSNWIPNSDLTVYLSAIQSNHILLISDACFSGGIFKTRSVSGMDQGMKRLYSLKSRKALTSGNLKEVPDQSVFMKFFIKSLEENTQPFLSTDQLFSGIRPAILNNSRTEPLYGVVYGTGDEGGEFSFFNEKAVEGNAPAETTELANQIRSTNKQAPKPVLTEENKKLDKPKRTAILAFDNSTGKAPEMGDIGGPLRDMLTSDLSDVENLRLVDRQALDKILEEQKRNNSKAFDVTTATRIGKLVGAEVIITGTFFEMYGSLRIDAKFIDVETGKIVFAVGVEGSREQFFDLKNRLANKIVEKLK